MMLIRSNLLCCFFLYLPTFLLGDQHEKRDSTYQSYHIQWMDSVVEASGIDSSRSILEQFLSEAGQELSLSQRYETRLHYWELVVDTNYANLDVEAIKQLIAEIEQAEISPAIKKDRLIWNFYSLLTSFYNHVGMIAEVQELNYHLLQMETEDSLINSLKFGNLYEIASGHFASEEIELAKERFEQVIEMISDHQGFAQRDLLARSIHYLGIIASVQGDSLEYLRLTKKGSRYIR